MDITITPVSGINTFDVYDGDQYLGRVRFEPLDKGTVARGVTVPKLTHLQLARAVVLFNERQHADVEAPPREVRAVPALASLALVDTDARFEFPVTIGDPDLGERFRVEITINMEKIVALAKQVARTRCSSFIGPVYARVLKS